MEVCMRALDNMGIRSKVFSGFGLVIVLLAGLAAVSYFGLRGADEIFTQYRALALNTNQLGRFDPTRYGFEPFALGVVDGHVLSFFR
jgi:hypothetical protein